MSIFSKVAFKKPKTSTFDLSCDRKFSLNMGELVPMHVQEVVPGDKITLNTSQIIRMAPMLAPMMHEVNVFTHFYFVPNRLVFEKWEEFITGGESGLDATLFPTIRGMRVAPGSLPDHLGLPLSPDGGASPLDSDVSALPFAAYQLIYNEYYRDQNLIDEVPGTKLREGLYSWISSEAQELVKLRRRAWQHDYLTSALPFSQKGNPVQLPLINTAGQYLDVDYNPNGVDDTWYNGNDVNNNLEGVHLDQDTMLGDTTGDPKNVDNSKRLSVPLDNIQANAASVNDLRKAFKVQEWLEKNARAGSRYVESLLAHFGVKSADARLQRPEFLGGGMSPVMISEVLQTSKTENDSPQGNMAGHGINLGRNHNFSRFFEEHGYIIGIVSVMPKTAYQQGIPRHFSKFDKFDYYWPEFQHLGEQEIKYREVMTNVSLAGHDPEDVFGYIPRYAEYKYNNSSVHGDFKATLDFWHLGRIFDPMNPPDLNQEFIECRPSHRIFAVEDSPEGTLYCQMFHKITANRRMAYFSDPSLR